MYEYLSIGGVIEGGGGGAGSFPVAPVTGCGMGSGGGLGVAGSLKLTEGGFNEGFPGTAAAAAAAGEGGDLCCCSLLPTTSLSCCSLWWPMWRCLFWSNFLRMSATETPLRMELATAPRPPSAAEAIAAAVDATAAANWH